MRRGKPESRPIHPDVRYNSVTLSTFIQHMMLRGKKSLALRLMYQTLDMIQEKTGKPGIETFDQAMKSVGPAMEVRPRRVGGATYQVPTEVRSERQLALALRWLIEAARSRKEKTMRDRIANELMDAANGRGGAITKRENTHKMAEANKAFSHYRW